MSKKNRQCLFRLLKNSLSACLSGFCDRVVPKIYLERDRLWHQRLHTFYMKWQKNWFDNSKIILIRKPGFWTLSSFKFILKIELFQQLLLGAGEDFLLLVHFIFVLAEQKHLFVCVYKHWKWEVVCRVAIQQYFNGSRSCLLITFFGTSRLNGFAKYAGSLNLQENSGLFAHHFGLGSIVEYRKRLFCLLLCLVPIHQVTFLVYSISWYQ